jgi:N-methylhydantoinase A/oxoprolinase/acetone carboxylase beta subunit
MAWRIGVDIAGTFTDVVLVDAGTGRIGVGKTPTTRYWKGGAARLRHRRLTRD